MALWSSKATESGLSPASGPPPQVLSRHICLESGLGWVGAVLARCSKDSRAQQSLVGGALGWK